MKISDLARELQAQLSGPTADLEICAGNDIVTNDSRRVVAGGIFVAVRGGQFDGNSFVAQAVGRGVAAVISTDPSPEGYPGYTGYWLRVADARIALAKAATLVHGDPSAHLALVGVTGTNGKTTTTYLVESLAAAAGLRSAAMGTISYRIGDEEMTAGFTTPEAPEIQNFLRRAVAAGVTQAVMEVSSIGLDMHRADGLHFAVAAFTNLTQDHLDFHGTMDSYFAAKRKLFDGSIGHYPENVVINVDDPYGRELAKQWPADRGRLWSYGIDTDAAITIAGRTDFGLNGLRFTAQTPEGEIAIDSPLVGRPHACNILCAVGIGLALGIAPEVVAEGIRQCRGVPGRFERVNVAADDITVIVDYAHTPDALANVLRTILDARSVTRQMPSGQAGGQAGRQANLTTVFGCGGDRDRSKRPMMGEEAGRRSDRVIITSDNPRSEDPLLIMNDIRVGIDRTGRSYEMIVDRREAIFKAITHAMPGDVILLAGKGHETYQILPSGQIDFDDREVARAALAERRSYQGRC
jgi:UDP-N-acetylmuramoyl-L-alanyl-D-glutamate--2,6-diaminopimelate ligase